jgi:hypothetical protein
MTSAPRILEIGEFSLFKRNLPAQTTFVFTGDNPARVRDLEHAPFGPAMAPGLLRALRRGAFDVVFAHPPARPAWDRSRGLPHAAAGLLRRLVRWRSFGTALLRARPAAAFAVLDFHDASTIPPPALALLEACDVYFKRELPFDAARAFRGVAARYAAPPDVVRDPWFRRHAGKLAPLSLAVSEDTARRALATGGSKSTDVFFAGSLAHSSLRSQGAAELEALATRGVVVDLCAGGLDTDAYLARCARARLAWSPEGYGWECFRHYEAALCGAVPVLSPPAILRHRPLEDGVHAFMYRPEAGGLAATILRALADPPALARMAAAARAHALEHHTQLRACERILDTTLRAAAARA